jgi:predicted HicB family RNase H-like nuclease
MMKYKSYIGHVTYDDEAKIFHGEIINIRDVVTFQGRSVDELETAFCESVEDYLAMCAERGEQPDKPFSGFFSVRIAPELHKRTVMAAKLAGKSLNAWVAEALRKATDQRSSGPL